jgi:uncharacterized protein YggE
MKKTLIAIMAILLVFPPLLAGENKRTLYVEESHWDREINKNVFDGYKVSYSLVVKIRDFEKIVPIMNGAIEAGATNIQQVTFVMENPKEYEKELREKTFKAVQEKAEHIAKLMGVRLGKPTNIHTSTAPVAISAPRTVESRPIIEPGEIVLYYSVSVTYEIE